MRLLVQGSFKLRLVSTAGVEHQLQMRCEIPRAVTGLRQAKFNFIGTEMATRLCFLYYACFVFTLFIIYIYLVKLIYIVLQRFFYMIRQQKWTKHCYVLHLAWICHHTSNYKSVTCGITCNVLKFYPGCFTLNYFSLKLNAHSVPFITSFAMHFGHGVRLT